jgi:hypothetical protein
MESRRIPRFFQTNEEGKLALIAAVVGMRIHARKRKATGPVNQDEGKAANR